MNGANLSLPEPIELVARLEEHRITDTAPRFLARLREALPVGPLTSRLAELMRDNDPGVRSRAAESAGRLAQHRPVHDLYL